MAKTRQIKSTSKFPVSGSKIIGHIFFLAVFGLAIYLLLPKLGALQHAQDIIQNLLPWALLVAVICQFISYLGSSYLLKSLIRLSNHSISVMRCMMINLAATSFGMAVGGIFGSATALYNLMKKEKISSESIVLVGSLPGLLNGALLALISTFGLIYLLLIHKLSNLELFAFAFTLFLLCLGIGFFIWESKRRVHFIKLVHRVGQWGATLRHQKFDSARINNLLSRLFSVQDSLLAGGWRAAICGATIGILFDMLTLYFIFIAAHNQISLEILLVGYGLPLLLGRIAFIIPGGIGVIETAMVGLYTGLGVPYSTAFAAVFAYRLVSFWLPLLIGFLMVPILQNRHEHLLNLIKTAHSKLVKR